MGEVALTNTINITLAGMPSGLANFSVNTILLASNEKPLSAEPYIWAVTPQDIIREYGTNSLTAKMGNELFTPAPNLRTGQGQVLVVPFKGTNAVASSETTGEIQEEQIEAFKLVNNGDLTISIDKNEVKLTNLDFTNIKSVEDIVLVLKSQDLDVDITVEATNKIKFTSRIYGTNSEIKLAKTSGGSGTDIFGATYLNGALVEKVQGANATGETLAEVVLRAFEKYGYFGKVITTQNCENELVLANMQAIAPLDCNYFEVTKSLKNMGVLGKSIKTASLSDEHLIAYSLDDEKIALAGYVSIASSTNYTGNDTALTMNLKEINGVLPDINLNQTYYNLAKENGVDIYANTSGLSCVYSFSNGKYTDEATMDLWLKKALEVAGFNYLRKTNTRIPQTEEGMNGLKNAYMQVLEQGVRNGCIGVGNRWNDSIPFGDAEAFQENIEKLGYYIYSIPVSIQPQAEREERKAPLIQIAIKRAGAIHSSDVIVNVQA